MRKKLLYLFLLILPGFLLPLSRPFTGIGNPGIPLPEYNDWDYFNALSSFNRTSFFESFKLPFHQPWACGGLDLLANPQTRIFSPLVILDLVLPPQWANVLTFILFGFLGAWGMFRFLSHFELKDITKLVGAVLFSQCGWFGLHEAEGHIVYAGVELIPWILVFCLEFEKKRSVFLFFSTFSLMILSGQMYALIFSGYAVLTLLVCNFQDSRSALFRSMRKFPMIWIGSIAFFICALCVRLIPFLSGVADVKPNIDLTSMKPHAVFKSLFWPFLNTRERAWEGSWRFHEFGCYIGIVSVITVVWASFQKDFLKENRFLWISVLFWLWVATGAGKVLNPWYLHRYLPLMNKAHVQSRLFIVMMVFYVVLLVRATDLIQNQKKKIALLAFLCLDFFFAKNYPYFDSYREYSVPFFSGILKGKTVEKTVAHFNGFQHYLEGNQSSRDCYEPSFLNRTIEVTDKHPEREVRVVTGNAKVKRTGYDLNGMRLTVTATDPSQVLFNTHWLSGWKVVSGEGRVFSAENGLVGLQIPAKNQEIELVYSPDYFSKLFLSFVIGIILWVILLKKSLFQ